MFDAAAVVGIMLSFLGLVGSFFWINLGDWLRDITEIYARFNAVHKATDPESLRELQRARSDIRAYRNSVPVVLTAGVSSFVVLVGYLSFRLLAQDPEASGVNEVRTVLVAFLIIYFVLTGWLLTRGITLARKISEGAGR